MTTTEAPAEVLTYSIVVCGTCDVVFRVHPGRPSCPVCGGEPLIVLYEGEIPASSNEEGSPPEGEAPAPASDLAGPTQDPMAPLEEQGQDQEEGQEEESTSPPEEGGDVSSLNKRI